jgi:putative phage-type endonuclease
MKVQEVPPHEEWLKLRKKYIGASEAPVLMNEIHFKKTPIMLWKEKLGLLDLNQDNAATRHGNAMEPIALEAYCNLIEIEMRAKMVFSDEHDFMMATLDGMDEDNTFAVEIKCPNQVDHEMALNGLVPQKYVAQVQHQLACTGHDKMHYYSFRNGEGALVEVERDDAYIRKLIAKEKRFWEDVCTFNEPALTQYDYISMKDDARWREAADELVAVENLLRPLLHKQNHLKEILKELAMEQNCEGNGIRARRCAGRRKVRYDQIPELGQVDLDKYTEVGKPYYVIEQVDRKKANCQ